MDSNHRSRKTADLQSAPFGHSGTRPKTIHFIASSCRCVSRASCRIRTNDPEITNHVLWPTELKRQFSKSYRETPGCIQRGYRLICGCKVKHYFSFPQTKSQKNQQKFHSPVIHISYPHISIPNNQPITRSPESHQAKDKLILTPRCAQHNRFLLILSP